MRCILILEIDPDKLLDTNPGTEIITLEEAVETEVGWLHDSGLSPVQVIMSDSLESNDQILGQQIRKLVNND